MKAADRRVYVKILVVALDAARIRVPGDRPHHHEVIGAGFVGENFDQIVAWNRGELATADLVAKLGLIDFGRPGHAMDASCPRCWRF